jgi:hypothetical protein
MSNEESIAAKLDESFVELMIRELAGQSADRSEDGLSASWHGDEVSEARADPAGSSPDLLEWPADAGSGAVQEDTGSERFDRPQPGRKSSESPPCGETPIVPPQVKQGKPVAPSAKRREPKRAGSSRLLLRVAEPDQMERVVRLGEKPLILGRGRDCDVVLVDTGVSRQHLRIDLREDCVMVEDLKSRNGTLINDHPVQGQEAFPGDVIRIGRTLIRIQDAGE